MPPQAKKAAAGKAQPPRTPTPPRGQRGGQAGSPTKADRDAAAAELSSELDAIGLPPIDDDPFAAQAEPVADELADEPDEPTDEPDEPDEPVTVTLIDLFPEEGPRVDFVNLHWQAYSLGGQPRIEPCSCDLTSNHVDPVARETAGAPVPAVVGAPASAVAEVFEPDGQPYRGDHWGVNDDIAVAHDVPPVIGGVEDPLPPFQPIGEVCDRCAPDGWESLDDAVTFGCGHGQWTRRTS